METNKEGKELARLLHDLDGVTNFVENLEERTDDTKLRGKLGWIQKELEASKAYIIESAVRDVMGAYGNCKKLSHHRVDISLNEAVALMEVVEQKAASMGLAVIVAIYNTAARPVAVHCMEDAFIASYDVAVNKAYTSAALKMSTSALKPLCQPGASLYGIQNTNDGKIVIFGGGEPLLLEDGTMIGAIGVSGSTEENDTFLAAYGREKRKEVMSQ